MSGEAWAETALQLNSFRPDESERSRVERYCDAVCGEMALAGMTLQADAAARRARVLAAGEPLCRAFSVQPRDRGVKFGLRPAAEAAVLSDEVGGVNLGRVPLGAELQAGDWSVDAAAVRGYAAALVALADGLTVRGMLAGCAGDDKDRDAVEAEVKRFRDRMLSLRPPLAPADAAAFLVRQQELAAHHLVLALQRCRELFLTDSDEHAGAVVREVLALVTGARGDAGRENLLWRGLPEYAGLAGPRGLGPCGVLAERSVWARVAGLVGTLGLKQRKTVLSQWQLVELVVATRMRNSVTIFADWQTLLIADLQRAILADAAHIAALEHQIIALLLKAPTPRPPTTTAAASQPTHPGGGGGARGCRPLDCKQRCHARTRKPPRRRAGARPGRQPPT